MISTAAAAAYNPITETHNQKTAAAALAKPYNQNRCHRHSVALSPPPTKPYNQLLPPPCSSLPLPPPPHTIYTGRFSLYYHGILIIDYDARK
jgi:hypothetical protein